MDVRSILLGFFMYRSMTGYELKKFFSISFSFFSGLSYGSIYPALKKMEQEGLITMRMERQERTPNRKIYTITEAGRETFLKALKAPFAFEGAKSAFLTHLFFFAYLSPEERLASTRKYLDTVREMLLNLEQARPEIEAHADEFQFLSFQFGLRFFHDLARNITGIIESLESKGSHTLKGGGS